MNKLSIFTLVALLAAQANAAVVKVSGDITSDTTWTASNTYVLTDVVFVTNGATLTIDQGTIVRGEPKSAGNYDPGTLVITREGAINANGSPSLPIIFTTAVLDSHTLDTDYSADIDYQAALDGGADWLDADPINAPLTPGAGFSTTAGDVSHIGTNGKYGDSNLGQNEYRGMWGGIIILGNAPTNCLDIVNGKAARTTKGNTAAVEQFETRELTEGDITAGEVKFGADENGENAYETVTLTTEVEGDIITATVENPAWADVSDIETYLNDPFEGYIEGLSPQTFGARGIYGGSNPNDSSGTLRYVGIRHGGTNLAADNEINGLTMGGVGFGTKLEYIEVYCNNDDGFEWFGGTVNSRYLISLYNNDDSYDIDDGFTGLGQFWFSLQIDDAKNGDHGGEHDGVNGNHDNVDLASLNNTALTATGDNGIGIPVAYPTIYNATYVQAGTAENTLKHEDSFGGNYYNSIFVGDGTDEFVNEGSDMAQRIASEDCDFVSNSYIYNHTGMSDDATLAADLSDNDNVYDNTTNPLNDVSNVRTGVDPRATSAAPGGLSLVPVTATHFINAGYAGAFNPDETAMWSDTWSVFSRNVDFK